MLLYRRQPRQYFYLQEANSLRLWLGGCSQEVLTTLGLAAWSLGVNGTNGTIDRVRQDFDDMQKKWKEEVEVNWIWTVLFLNIKWTLQSLYILSEITMMSMHFLDFMNIMITKKLHLCHFGGKNLFFIKQIFPNWDPHHSRHRKKTQKNSNYVLTEQLLRSCIHLCFQAWMNKQERREEEVLDVQKPGQQRHSVRRVLQSVEMEAAKKDIPSGITGNLWRTLLKYVLWGIALHLWFKHAQ